jgi:hypothetical protein
MCYVLCAMYAMLCAMYIHSQVIGQIKDYPITPVYSLYFLSSVPLYLCTSVPLYPFCSVPLVSSCTHTYISISTISPAYICISPPYSYTPIPISPPLYPYSSSLCLLSLSHVSMHTTTTALQRRNRIRNASNPCNPNPPPTARQQRQQKRHLRRNK